MRTFVDPEKGATLSFYCSLKTLNPVCLTQFYVSPIKLNSARNILYTNDLLTNKTPLYEKDFTRYPRILQH